MLDEFDYLIELEQPELFALEFRKIDEFDFFYTLASANINQSASNLVKMYMNNRSQMSLILYLVGPELPQLFALELRKVAAFDFVYALASTNINQSASNLVKMCMTIRSHMSSI